MGGVSDSEASVSDKVYSVTIRWTNITCSLSDKASKSTMYWLSDLSISMYWLKATNPDLRRELQTHNQAAINDFDSNYMSQGNRMQANVLKRWFWRFEQYLEENACLLIKNPNLGCNNAKYKYSDNPNKICLTSETYVSKCTDFEAPEHGFCFTSFRSIIDEGISEFTTIDVIGHIDRFFPNDKTDNKLTMEIKDLEGNNVYLTLWNSYANQMRLYASGHLDEEDIVIILQFGRVKIYNGNPYVSNSFGDVVSRLFINSSVDDIINYKKRLVEMAANNPSSTHRPFGMSMFISTEDDFLTYTEFSKIAEICDIEKKKHVILLATIKAISKDVGWHYMGCKKCPRKLTTTFETRVKEDGNGELEEVKVVECPKCKSQYGAEVPRFKIQIRVQDITGAVSLTLFDRDATQLLEKSAKDLLDIYGEDFPEEINSLVEKRFAFKIEVSEYNFKNNYQVYGVSALTDDSSIVSKLDEKFMSGQPSDSDSVNMSMFELPSCDHVAMKDTLSCTDDNMTPLSNVSQSFNTGHLSVEKVSSIMSTKSLLKRKLVDIYDVDESPMTSSSKSHEKVIPEKQNRDVNVKLLIPKVEK